MIGGIRIFMKRVFLFFPVLFLVGDLHGATLSTGWGADAVLSLHVAEQDVPDYLDLLKKKSGVRIIRERNSAVPGHDPSLRDPFTTWTLLNQSGFQVVAFAQENRDLGGTDWGPFPEDLRVVFEEGKRLGRTYARHVYAWELHNEPELAWWPDMPDRYVAHAKALYLGLKAGAREAGEDTPVLLGALGLPAGSWLERAARNGVHLYADAWNIHYYGESDQFPGFLDGHLEAMRSLRFTRTEARKDAPAYHARWRLKRSLSSAMGEYPPAVSELPPVWVTEAGINTVTASTWQNADRRQRQADFILATAREALGRPEVAVYMPFILVRPGDSHALMESPAHTWPAWDEYARFSLDNPWPPRVAAITSRKANPIVLQWLADSTTASGHKLSAAYRWRADAASLRGQLRIYNFGTERVRGKLTATRGDERSPEKLLATRSPFSGQVDLPPGGMLSLPVAFAIDEQPFQGSREWRQYTLVDDKGGSSELGFGLERSPDLYPPRWQALTLGEWGCDENVPTWEYLPRAISGETRGPWSAVNGVKVLYAKGALARFEIGPDARDPLFPPYVAAALPGGLPPAGWIRVAARSSGPVVTKFRVDLIDHEGRRFTQWENLGHVRGLPLSAPRWLNLADFHPYAWGKLDVRRRLVPSEVREVQLRFYAARGPAMIDVELGYGAEYGDVLEPAGEVVMRRVKDTAASAPVE